MGGNPPLGYKPEGRSLEIVSEHAELIRTLFRRYLAIGNVRLLAEQLEEEDTRVPKRMTATGRTMGGGLFTRGQIYKLLSNPIYLGEIHHQGMIYDGKHQAIINRELWDEVQARLASNTQGPQRAATAKSPSLLAGLVFDESGEPLVAAHACKGKVRYRYYVSRALQHDAGAKISRSIRIPALELEKAVSQCIAGLFDDPLELASRASLEVRPDELERFASTAGTIAAQLLRREQNYIRTLLSRVTVERDRISVELSSAAVAKEVGLVPSPAAPETINLTIDASIRRTGRAVRIVLDNGKAATPSEPQDHLVRLSSKARSWWHDLVENSLTASDLARRHGVTPFYASRIVRLNFLAPDIVETILAGKQQVTLDARRLLALHDLPLDWSEQRRELHII